MLPLMPGGLNPHNPQRLGKFFVLDLADPNPALQQAALLAFDTLRLPEKLYEHAIKVRFFALWPQHPDATVARTHTAALMAYLEASPIAEERLRWFECLAAGLKSRVLAALDLARKATTEEGFDLAAQAFAKLEKEDHRMLQAAGYPQAEIQARQYRAAFVARNNQKLESAYRAAAAQLDACLSQQVPGAPDTGATRAARGAAQQAWASLTKDQKKKWPKPA